MKYDIILAPEAIEDMAQFTAFERTQIKDALETHVRHEPMKVSRSRIKRLRGLSKPQFRLRVDHFRVFYDVEGSTVNILAIVPKGKAEEWLKQFGEP